MDTGLELRQARERRGISLQQLSQSTKISLRVLQALERGDADVFPAPVYTRGFVRTYAKEVGLPDDVVRRYMAELEPPAPVNEVAPNVETRRTPAALRISIRPPDLRPLLAFLRRRPFVVGSAVVVVGLVTLALRAPRHTPPPTASVVAGRLPPAVVREPVPVATTGAAARSGLHIEIAPTGACWVRASIDGQRMFAILMKAGDRRTLTAPSHVTLRLGDAAACAMTINGTPARIGVAGQPVTAEITTNNYARFLTK